MAQKRQKNSALSDKRPPKQEKRSKFKQRKRRK
jgi:hypothetical protein